MPENKKTTYQTIDEYISLQPMVKQEGLKRLREIIKNALPTATETISYQMPAFKTEKVVVWFASYRYHYGVYPYPKTIEKFKEKLINYNTSKGAIQLPIDEPLPENLITEMVVYSQKEVILQQLKKRDPKIKLLRSSN